VTLSLQGPGSQNSPEPFADLVTRLKGLQRELGDVTNAVLRSAGIRVSPEGMSVESALAVLGALDVSGDATFSGDMRIEGTLSLPAGIIDNEALANPLELGANFGAASGFGLTGGSWVEVTSASITIPAGFTRLQFVAAGMVNAVNSTGGTQNLYVQVGRQINGAGEMFLSPQAQNALPAGFTGTATALYVWNEAVNPGETHRFSMRAWVSASFAPTGGNYTRLDVAATFTR